MLHGEAFISELLMLPSGEINNYKFIGASLPYYLYPVLLFIGLLPFSGIFLKAIFTIRKLLSDDLIKFLAIWFVLAFLLLPLSQPESLFSPAYCLPPLFIIMARTEYTFGSSMNLFIWPLLFICPFLFIPFLAPYAAESIGNKFIRNALVEGTIYLDASYRLILGAVIMLLTALSFIKPVPSSLKYGVLGLLFVSMINFLILPISGNIFQQPVKSAAFFARKENLNVIPWKVDYPSFNVYAEKLTEVRAPVSGDVVLTRLEYLKNGVAYEALFEKHGIALVQILKIPADKNSRSLLR